MDGSSQRSVEKKTSSARIQNYTGANQVSEGGPLGDLCSLGPKHLLHPLATTFGNFLFSTPSPKRLEKLSRSVAVEVAIYRMGNWPGAKIPGEMGKKVENGPTPKMAEKWQSKWKKWPKSGQNPIFGSIFHFDCHFSAISDLEQFPFSVPFFRDFCSGPVSHSVNGHFNRNRGV